jgi:hypothetical protein
MPCAATTRLSVARALPQLRLAPGQPISLLDFSSVGRIGSCRASGHCISQRDYSSSGLHQLYCAYAVHPNASSRRSTSRQSVALALAVCPVIPLCVVTTRLAVATDILRIRHASGCIGKSHGSSRGSSCRSSSTTSTTLHVRVPRHVARLIASLVVDYFAYVMRPGASVCRAASRAAHRRLLRLAQACHRLLRLRRAFGCLGMSRGLSRGSSRRSSSTTSPTLRVWVPRHGARLVTWHVVDYSVRRDFVLRPHWLYFSHAVRRDYLSRGNTSSTSSTPRAAIVTPPKTSQNQL